MAEATSKAHIALFYGTILTSVLKGHLNKVLTHVKAKAGEAGTPSFKKHSFLDANEFTGHVDSGFDAVIIEGTVNQTIAERIRTAYEAAGIDVRVESGSFEDLFRPISEELGIPAGVTDDPPHSLTDNVTAARNMPQAHVETDGRNAPKPVATSTGTSLDRFGLPLSTTDRPGEGTALAAQGAAVRARAAEGAAQHQETREDIAERTRAAAEAAAKLQQEQREAAEAAEKKAREEAEAREAEEAERKEKAHEEAEAKKAEQAKTGTAKPASAPKAK